MTYPTHLIPTTVVGSYPQPDWLIDRSALEHHGVPRVHAHEIWRVPEPQLREAQDDATVVAIFTFVYFAMLDTKIPALIFIAVALSFIPVMTMYGPEAALIAEAFTPRLRYSGASLGYQLASVIAGGPAPLIAAWLFSQYHSGYAIAVYILACSVLSVVATMMLGDYTNKDISHEYA